MVRLHTCCSGRGHASTSKMRVGNYKDENVENDKDKKVKYEAYSGNPGPKGVEPVPRVGSRYQSRGSRKGKN